MAACVLILTANDADKKADGDAMSHPLMQEAVADVSPMVFGAKRNEIIDAVVVLPKLKSLMAAFGASTDLHALTQTKDLKEVIGLMPAVIARAESRIAQGLISSTDRRLASEDVESLSAFAAA